MLLRRISSIRAALALTSLLIGTMLLALTLSSGRAQQPTQFVPAESLNSEDWPQRVPELIGTDRDWINTGGKALSIRDLIRTHHPILIDFWEYTCVNCLRTLPYLKEWNRRYAKDGLVIIGIHTPEFRFAHDPANVATAVKQLGIDWPVLVDSDYKNWTAFRNNYWPRHFFVDIHGNIVDDRSGEGGYDTSELILQRLLKEAHPNLALPVPMSPLRGEDTPGARCYPMTPEIYAGARGIQSGQLGNINEFASDRAANYPAPTGALEDGRIYVVGNWRTEEESLRHGRASAALTDRILLRYHAVEVNAVIKPETHKPLRVYVTQDNRPIPNADKGEDVRYNSSGDSYVLVDQPRMYRLIRNAKFGSHVIALASHSEGFGLYSFTFTSCEAP